MKWPQRWVAAFVVTLPAGKGKGSTAICSRKTASFSLPTNFLSHDADGDRRCHSK